MLWKYLVLQLWAKRSKGVTNRHKNDDASYIHAKEIEKWNKNAMNAIITCVNNIQKNCFIAMRLNWFYWTTVSSKIWYILVIFGLSRHSHNYIYLVKALIFIGLLILFICSWFTVIKISSCSFLLIFCAFLALLFSLFE